MASDETPSAIIFWKDFDSEHTRGMIATDQETINRFWKDDHKRGFVHAFPSTTLPPATQAAAPVQNTATVQSSGTVAATGEVHIQPEKINTVATS